MHVRSIASNSIFILSGRVFSRILDIVFIILLTRYLGPAKLGIYQYIFVYISTFAVFVDLGLNSILIRENAQHRNRTSELMGNGLTVGFIASFFFILCSVIIIQFIPDTAETKSLIIIACFSIFVSSRFKSFRTLLEVMFTVELRMGYVALINVLDRVLVLGVLLILLSHEPSLSSIVLFVVLVDVPGFLLTAILYRKFFGKLKLKPNFQLIQTLLGYSLPILLMAIFNLLNLRIDVLILKYLKGYEAVGYYSTGTRIPEVLNFIPMAFGMSVYPILSRKIVTNYEAFIEVFRTSAKYLLFVGTPMIVYLFAEADILIPLLFKEEYIPSIPVLKVVVFAGIAFFVSDLFYSALIISKREKLCFIITALSALTHIGLTFLFVYYYGIVGAGLATVIAYSLFLILGFLFEGAREFTTNILKMLIRPSAAGIVMGVFILMIKMHFIFALIVGSFVYLAVFLLVGGFNKRDRDFLRELVLKKTGESIQA